MLQSVNKLPMDGIELLNSEYSGNNNNNNNIHNGNNNKIYNDDESYDHHFPKRLPINITFEDIRYRVKRFSPIKGKTSKCNFADLI